MTEASSMNENPYQSPEGPSEGNPFPNRVRIVIGVDMLLCLIRVATLLSIVMGGEPAESDGSFVWSPIVSNGVVILGAWLGGGMLAARQRAGIIPYWISLVASSITLTVAAYVISTVPIEGPEGVIFRVGTGSLFIAVLFWYREVAVALLQADRFLKQE